MKSDLEILTEICEKEGYKVEKELKNRYGYAYYYYAVKDSKKIQLGYIGNFGNKHFLTIEELKEELKEC